MRRTGVHLVVLLLAFIVLPTANLFADQIVLKNGDRLSGAIVKSDAKTLVLKTDFEGDVAIQWGAIDTITSTQPLHLALNGGQMLVGPVTTSGTNLSVATANAGTVTTAKDSIVAIRSDAEEKAYEAQLERLQHPHLLDFWSGFLDTGLSITKGNSDTISYTLAGQAIRATDRDKITITTSSIFSKSDTTIPDQVLAKEINGGVRVDLNVTPRTFGFGFTNFDYNALQHLNLENVLGGGAGYHVIKRMNATFDLLAGGDYNQEFFSSYTLPNATPPPAALTIAAVTQRTAEVTVGEQLDAKTKSRVTFTENFTVFPGLQEGAGYRFVFVSSAATKLKTWLSWQVTFNDRFLSNPPFGIQGNDLLLSTGLRLTYGKTTP